MGIDQTRHRQHARCFDHFAAFWCREARPDGGNYSIGEQNISRREFSILRVER
jgi:hypothetical protein